MNYEEITEILSKKLKHRRFVHSMGVAYTAANLAMCHGYDMNKAFLAGLLHDCAKYMSDEESIEYCQKHNIQLSKSEIEAPALIHAKAGKHMAQVKYEVEDSEVLDAIRWHTTGHSDMKLHEKILFVADYIEPNRDHDKDLPIIRALAYSDLDKCIALIYENTLLHIKTSNKKLDPTSKEAYEYYKTLCENR